MYIFCMYRRSITCFPLLLKCDGLIPSILDDGRRRHIPYDGISLQAIPNDSLSIWPLLFCNIFSK